MIGVGGQHASTLAAFLDLPESHKWPRHFTTLEKFMHSGIDMIKIKSQEMSTKTEVSQAVQADGEAAHLPIPRIMASFDMGWQVRSSGGKYGSCTGHAMLIGAHSRKIMDSIVYNKRCTICNKHKQRRIETGQIVKKHECMKNNDGTSKSTEAAALVCMLCRIKVSVSKPLFQMMTPMAERKLSTLIGVDNYQHMWKNPIFLQTHLTGSVSLHVQYTTWPMPP